MWSVGKLKKLVLNFFFLTKLVGVESINHCKWSKKVGLSLI
jgi:hypothetical protein